jgi:hypothetical protein
VRPGDRIVSSADGAVFPQGLLVGQVVMGSDRRLRASLAADYARLEFLRVLRSQGAAPVEDERRARRPAGATGPEARCPSPPPRKAPMAETLLLRRLIWQGVFLALRALSLFAQLLPLDRRRRPAGARLLVLMAFAWVLRRPDYVPVFLVAA